MRKPSILSSYLLRYVSFHFVCLLFFLLITLYIMSAIIGRAIDLDMLQMTGFYALLFTIVNALSARHRCKDLFRFLESHSHEVDFELEYVSKAITVDCITIDDVVVLLNETELILTLVDKPNGLVKFRQKFKPFETSCGGMITFDAETKTITVTSFPFDYNKKEKAIRLNKKICKLIGVEGIESISKAS